MNIPRFLSLSIFLMLALSLSAQQSSLSKSKKRFREKEVPGNRITVSNLTALNSKFTDYSPVFFQNGIVYVSSRQKLGAQDKRTGETYSELYFAPFDPNRQPANPQKFSVDINSKLNEGPVTFSKDYKTMFYTQNNMKGGVQKADSKGFVRLKIYEAKKGQLYWAPQGELPFNSNEYSCMHPSLSANGELLYFTSDMPGGFGGYDLYVSKRDVNGAWMTPENLGPGINTEKSEVFPFMHPNGTLFFSSNGHNTIGGLDIFYVEVGDNGEQVIVNLDAPYNSKEDDLGFIIDDDLKSGFFASNRLPGIDGGGGTLGKDDIFSFTIEKGIQGLAPTTRPARIVVTDAVTGKPIQGVELRILKSSADGFVDNEQGIYDIDLAPVNGDPERVSLQLRPKSAGQMRRADFFSNAAGEARLEFLRYRSYVVMANHPNYMMTQQFVTSEDETEDAVIRVKLSTAPLCHRVQGIVLTDQMGTRVANATIKLTHKASGRAETGRTNLNGEYDVCLPQDGDYLVQVVRPGFSIENYNFTASLNQAHYQETRLRPTKIGGAATEEQPLAEAVQSGSVIVLDKISYEPNAATLNQTAVRNLDALYELLQRYPKMEIEIVCHTDTRGDAKKNLALSLERAQNAQAYLVFRGITEPRIQVAGKGGSEPRNKCAAGVFCSEEEHLANLRMEVKVK